MSQDHDPTSSLQLKPIEEIKARYHELRKVAMEKARSHSLTPLEMGIMRGRLKELRWVLGYDELTKDL